MSACMYRHRLRSCACIFCSAHLDESKEVLRVEPYADLNEDIVWKADERQRHVVEEVEESDKDT